MGVYANIETSNPLTKNITATTITISNNMNRKAINAMAIRSHQVGDEMFAGSTTGNSFEETRALKLDSEHVL